LRSAFFCSGAAALLFEVLWFRSFGRVLGNTVWTAALVLSAFMLGIAVGGLAATRLSRSIRRPAHAFALAEGVVGVAGCLIVLGLPLLEAPVGRWLAPLAGHPDAMSAARLGLALVAMLVPTIAMGMTLPLGVRALAQRDTSRALGGLYAANTFGACLAPVLAESYLIGALGLRGTALCALLLNMAAARLALRSSAPQPAPEEKAPVRWNLGLLAAAAVAGAVALALEVIWFRLLVLHAPATDATFALLLMLMLLGIALGSALAPHLARVPLAWVAAAASLAVLAGYWLALPAPGSRLNDIVYYAAVLMLPAAAASGALFTLLGSALRGSRDDPQPAIGWLTFANTLGAAAGAALAGFWMLPQLGIEKSLFALAAAYAVLPLIIARRLLPVAVAAAALLLFPFGRIDEHLARAAALYRMLDGSSVARVIQGPTTTLQILRTERYGEATAWRLVSDSYSMASIRRESLRYMQLFAWLPLALHEAPRRALLVSYGAGNTARALLDDPGLSELTVVDVSPEMLAASGVIHGKRDPLADPRVRRVLEDGRHFLRTRREQFDLITAEPPPPMMAGVVNLYTREYFNALAARLAPGGLATYWLPARQFEPRGARAVIAAFCDAFPDCTLWSGVNYEWILMGGRRFEQRASLKSFVRLWQRPESAARLEASGFEHPAQLGATFLADAAQLRPWIAETAPLTDDFPKRIAAGRPLDPAPEEYRRWLEPGSAERNFLASRWVAAHWPLEFTVDTARLFWVQAVLNGQAPAGPAQRLKLLDALLRETNLGIPVLWLLGSDDTEQRILARHRSRDPEQAYPLGVAALAQHDYPRAARFFAIAAKQDRERADELAAFAACRARSPRSAAC